MELKIVYRTLRTVSDYVMDGFYAEVLVEGQENVPKDGPLVIGSTHSNDMVDIATLCTQIPNRGSRFLCFWAKSDMFKNPVASAILRSTGAVPVRRNPDNLASARSRSSPSSSSNNGNSTDMSARAALFEETSKVLAKGGVIGIFPEGGSYTGWGLMKLMPGAAWCGVEHARARKDALRWAGGDEAEVLIVPTAITYTDSAKYLSRVHVRFGTPISLADYLDELFDQNADPNAAANTVVKKVTTELETRLAGMVVNAADWDSVCAVSAARQILWTDEDRIQLRDWVEINQQLTKALEEEPETKRILVQYHSLLCHAGIKHHSLATFSPLSNATPPTIFQSLVPILRPLPLSLVRFVAFLPPFLLFLPGYLSGPLAVKALSKPLHFESHSQFKSIAAGLGIAANASAFLAALWKATPAPSTTLAFVKRIVFGEETVKQTWLRVGRGLAVAYLSIWVLAKWHKLLVKSNYKELQKLQACWKILRYRLFGTGQGLDPQRLRAYTKPVYPARNPWLRPRAVVASEDGKLEAHTADSDKPLPPPPPPRISSSKLMSALFDSRAEASGSLSALLAPESTLIGSDGQTLREFLVKKGATFPSRS